MNAILWNCLGGRSNLYQEVKKKKEVDLKRIPDIERWADHSLISCLKVRILRQSV